MRSGKLGGNLIRFLLTDMRNRTIKAQAYKPYGNMPAYNGEFDGLRIKLASKSFELMPFAFSPKEARPSLYTLFELYDAPDAVNEQNLRSRLISRLLKVFARQKQSRLLIW